MGDIYGLVEGVGISNQENKRRQGLLTPKGTCRVYMLSIVLSYKNAGEAGTGYLMGEGNGLVRWWGLAIERTTGGGIFHSQK